MKRTQTPEVSPLRAARKAAGLSLEQLAVHAGLSRVTVTLAERAPELMTKRTADAVSRVLKVPVSSILPRGAR